MDAHKIRILRSIIECVFLVCIIILFFGFLRVRSQTTSFSFDSGWDITFEEHTYKDQDVTKFVFPRSIQKGDEVILTNTIPSTGETQPTISFLSFLSVVDMHFDGEHFYEHGLKAYDEGKMIGSGYHRIRLPDNCEGRELSIRIVAGEDNAFTNIEPIELLDSYASITGFAGANAYNFFISIFLMIVGVVLPLVAILFYFMDKEYERLVLIGALAFCMGTWSLCNTKIIQIFSVDLEWNTMLEYIMLYMAPLPALRIIDLTRSEKDRTTGKNAVIITMAAVMSIFFISAIVLHVTNIIHICQLLPYFHVVAAVGVITCFGISFQPFSNLSKSDKLMYIALLTMIIAAVLDMIRFNFEVYVEKGFSLLRNSFLPAGTLVFIMLLIIGYLNYLYEYYIVQVEKQVLEKQAYTDTLTGLYNRTYFEKELVQIAERNEDYGIISMDLNGLKMVNDTYGHASGDALLTTFADILRESFEGLGDIVRMGGDEFIILLRDKGGRDVARGLIKMDQLERQKSKEMPFEIRTAFGEAYSNECKEKDPEAVYRLADARMYDMKRKTKSRKGAVI